LKVSKEFKTGLLVILSLVVLFMGVNFLKGDHAFGRTPNYFAVFESSAFLEPSSAVYLNGVTVGLVKSIENHPTDLTKVIVRFTITKSGLKIPKGSFAEIASPNLLSKGLILHYDYYSKSFHNERDTLPGQVALDISDAVTQQLLPVKDKLERLMSSIEHMVVSINSFWDTTAAQSLDGSLLEVKVAISRFGNLAKNLDELVFSEKIRLSQIMTNVEQITSNLNASNQKITKIIGNVESLTDTLLTSEFKNAIASASLTLNKINSVLENAANGEGTLGKLLHDDALHQELLSTNKALQSLVNDIERNPERYIHFSVLGRKEKAVKLTPEEEKRLRQLIK
jgi:phospholipid/cholesterol/gamma-HCH transport system substrate-binding protein